MVIIQDDNIPSAHEKPLRISGDPHKCQRAKEMVLELLAEREMKVVQRNGQSGDLKFQSSCVAVDVCCKLPLINIRSS